MTLYVFLAGGNLQVISATDQQRAKDAAVRNNGGDPVQKWYGKVPTSSAPIVRALRRLGFRPTDHDHLLAKIQEWS